MLNISHVPLCMYVILAATINFSFNLNASKMTDHLAFDYFYLNLKSFTINIKFSLTIKMDTVNLMTI